MYRDCFAPWTLIERLRITGLVAAHFAVDALLTHFMSDGQLAFPHLRVLEVANVEWGDTIDLRGDSFGAKLSHALQVRRRAGARLETLLATNAKALEASPWWEEFQDVNCKCMG